MPPDSRHHRSGVKRAFSDAKGLCAVYSDPSCFEERRNGECMNFCFDIGVHAARNVTRKPGSDSCSGRVPLMMVTEIEGALNVCI